MTAPSMDGRGARSNVRCLLGLAAVMVVWTAAGCVGPGGDGGGDGGGAAAPTAAAVRDHSIGGAFTADRTEQDFQDFEATVRPYGGDVAILESFPEQFVVSRLTEAGCNELRPLLAAKDYLASVSACRRDAGPIGAR